MKLPQWMLESSLPPNKWQLPVEVNMARWPTGYPAIVKVVLTAFAALVCTLLCLHTLWNSHSDWNSHRLEVIYLCNRKVVFIKPGLLLELEIVVVLCHLNVLVFFHIFHNFTQQTLPLVPLLQQQRQHLDISKNYNCFQRASETTRCLETSPVLCSGCAGPPLRGSLG